MPDHNFALTLVTGHFFFSNTPYILEYKTRTVNAVMNLRVPSNAGNSFSSLGHVSFSRRTLLYEVHLSDRSCRVEKNLCAEHAGN
jgi:hypothetical protein